MAASEECAERFRQRLLILDADGDGSLTLDEFRAGVASEPALMRALACVGISPGAGAAPEDPVPALPRRLAARRAKFMATCCLTVW